MSASTQRLVILALAVMMVATDHNVLAVLFLAIGISMPADERE